MTIAYLWPSNIRHCLAFKYLVAMNKNTFSKKPKKGLRQHDIAFHRLSV